VLMKKTLGRARDAQGLRELLAVSIQDAAAREAFIQGRHSTSVRSQPLSQPLTQPLTTQPPGAVPGARGSRTVPISGRGSTSGVPNFEPAQLEVLERALSQHIGPLARTLVRREAGKHQDWNALVQALAQQIDKASDRQRFLAAAGKAPR
jgi:hypothetical protein